jgi:hypothetical protein
MTMTMVFWAVGTVTPLARHVVLQRPQLVVQPQHQLLHLLLVPPRELRGQLALPAAQLRVRRARLAALFPPQLRRSGSSGSRFLVSVRWGSECVRECVCECMRACVRRWASG